MTKQTRHCEPVNNGAGRVGAEEASFIRTTHFHQASESAPKHYCISSLIAEARLTPLHSSSRRNKAHRLLCVIVKCSLYTGGAQCRTTKRTPLSLYQLCGCCIIPFLDSCHCLMLSERNGHSGYRSCPQCVIMLILVHEQLYAMQKHRPKCQGSVLYLRKVWSTHTSQTNWNLGSNMFRHGTDCLV